MTLNNPVDFKLLCCLIFLDKGSDTFVVSSAIFFEQVVGFSLRRRFRIWVIQKILDTEEYLFDRDSRLPPFVLIKD